MKKLFLALLLLTFAPLVFSSSAGAKVVTKEIPYKDGKTELLGYYAYDNARKGPLPGVIVVHEWWGYNAYAKKRAEMLAGLGYVAFAIDMYGKGKAANNPDEAKTLSNPFYENRSLMQSRALAGLKTLTAQPQVDGTRLGAVGYCFGGTVALELARSGEDLKGVAAFHANLATPEPAEAGRVKAQVLALNGGDDKFVSPKERKNFAAEMKSAGVNFKIVEYPGATHAFTNPKATEIGKRFDMPISYNESADKQSWAEMKKFFTRLFSEKPADAAEKPAETTEPVKP